ncbi:MAG TPA: tripartite tricarboxylate transporter substrate binding protein [Burkholderiales bacterium]|nr:tripartite tricarboxylate transporter substrate binding protein [Burkholderiales bacterium]
MTRVVVVLAALLWSLQCAAQSWPSKPVRIVVPLGAGGFADVPARLLAPHLAAQLNGTFFVENRPGAGSTIGADYVARSDPDGYTLLFSATPHVISAHLYRTLGYDSLKSFAPVALIASGPYVLVVHPDLPAASVPELIAAAKAQPGRIDYASSGNGSAQHLVTALFAAAAGIELNHIPYKGSGQAMQDLLGGRVRVSMAGVPNVLNHVRAGKLRALGVTTPQRWPDMPEVPTIAEAGVPGYEATLWLCMLAPAGTPEPVVSRLSAAIGKALGDPEMLKLLRTAGISPSYLGPQEFGAFMRAEYDKWGRVVKQTGATIN